MHRFLHRQIHMCIFHMYSYERQNDRKERIKRDFSFSDSLSSLSQHLGQGQVKAYTQDCHESLTPWARDQGTGTLMSCLFKHVKGKWLRKWVSWTQISTAIWDADISNCGFFGVSQCPLCSFKICIYNNILQFILGWN